MSLTYYEQHLLNGKTIIESLEYHVYKLKRGVEFNKKYEEVTEIVMNWKANEISFKKFTNGEIKK